jgi:glycosyltransferase involved in cell wall biosynthesis
MNCLNCEKYLAEAIDSVFSQTFDDWEILFWDNASTDSSAAIAKAYPSRVRYHRSDETVPLGEARNRAIEQASGTYIAFLDCDDLWLPEKLERQIPLFSNPKVGLVFSESIFFNASGQERPFYGNNMPERGDVFRSMLGSYRLSLETVIIRRSALDGLSELFDPRFEVIEEKDLFLRVAHDWHVDFVEDALAKWRIHEESWTWTRKDLFPQETELMIDKFKALYPGFEQRHVSELESVRASIAHQYAMADWEKGRFRAARSRLRPFALRNRKFLITYVMMLGLPHRLYRKVVSMVRVLPT